MEFTNYMKLKNWRPFTCQYMFVDTGEYLADRLFVEQKIPVHFGREFSKDGSKYRIITCRIRKCHEELFEKALKALPDKMLLLGHNDYAEFCRNFFTRLRTDCEQMRAGKIK